MSLAALRRAGVLACAATAALAGSAAAEPLTPVRLFANATFGVQAIILGLAGSILAAIAVCAVKLAQGPRLSGGSAYLSGLRVGGPLAGLLGATWSGLNMAIGLANVTYAVPVNVLARGAAEVLLLVGLGLLSGAVAVIANWAVEARIDRAVLKA